MTLDVTSALRVMAWLLVPKHLLAVYAFEVVEFVLAVIGAVWLARIAGRRYARALATLALATALSTATATHRYLPSPRRPGFAQYRLVHAAHPPRRPVTGTAVAEKPRSAVVCAPRSPMPDAVPDPDAAAAPIPPRPAARYAAALSEQELLALANTTVIGPLIEACRQAAGGTR